ncbi:MAG TPA: proton-conducting transporter membrane subunit [Tepidisphaeraceae bacterium]|jgi:NADH:ubiquinone oxidoreductase subunit 5 (subunit L)/multisubunit Na+/H+ antiporter MnhA subunit
MPLPALLLVIATLLPLAGLVLLLAIGKRIGDPLAGWITTALAAGSFALSMAAMIAWYEGGQLAGMTWGPGDKPIELSYLHLDTLTVAMFNTITLVVALSHAFSVRYMRDDKRFVRFFTYLQLSCFSMLAFVLSSSLLEIFVFWYLIALAGYLLLTRLNDSPSRSGAILSFLVNRIGDAGFLLGAGILFYFLGNATLLQMDRWLWSAAGSAVHLPSGAWISGKTLTLIGIAIFCGAASRSAQFPLHFWLPASSKAPIPAAAFVQSSTLTAAGLYLIARMYPILTPTAKLCIGITGLVSLLIGALLALPQRDIGRILAYSTVSQFGLMFMAIGIGNWIGGLFHLLAHAFFKSLVILAAGSAIHALGTQNLSDFGGLIRKMPLAGVTFAIGLLAMAGAPFTCGYYSYQTILINAGAIASIHDQPLYWSFFIIPAVVSGITALYTTRCWMLLFWGQPRNRELHFAARERTGFWFPLFGLAAVTLIGGSRLLDIKQFISQSALETENYCNAMRDPASPPFAAFTPAWIVSTSGTNSAPEDSGEHLFNRFASWPFGAGVLLGFVLYCRRTPAKIA